MNRSHLYLVVSQSNLIAGEPVRKGFDCRRGGFEQVAGSFQLMVRIIQLRFG